MTRRARWLMFLALVGTLAGVVRGQSLLALVSLSTMLWILGEWLRFQLRIRTELPRLRFERLVNGRSEPTGSLRTGQKTRIDVHLNGRPERIGILLARDVVPDILELPGAEGRDTTHGGSGSAANSSQLPVALQLFVAPRRMFSLKRDKTPTESAPPNEAIFDSSSDTARLSYVAIARAAGQVTFPGLRLTLQDPCGFFELHRFVRVSQTFRILPDYFQSGELRPTVKRHNSLPRHGIHRLQREGVGSELLELREYVAGDPPKSIAWKVSARRGVLMTRKYESEVPVRVHLFVDGSTSTRLGGYGLRLLDQINFVASSVAKAATSVGDPVSGMLVNETGVRRMRWMSGDRGFLQLLKELADFASHPPPSIAGVTPQMMQAAVRICQERFPELLARRYQRIPFAFSAAPRERFLVVGVLAELFQLTPRQQVECYYDDKILTTYLQQFLYRAGMAWMDPLITPPGQSALAPPGMILLGKAIQRAIANARDNEVFVVLADLLNCTPSLAQLIPALKLAISKHHRVAFVCPTTTFQRSSSDPILPRSDSLRDLLLASEQTRIRELSFALKHELVRLGVSVSFSGERQAIQMVLAEMDMARDGRTRLQGIRS